MKKTWIFRKLIDCVVKLYFSRIVISCWKKQHKARSNKFVYVNSSSNYDNRTRPNPVKKVSKNVCALTRQHHLTFTSYTVWLEMLCRCDFWDDDYFRANIFMSNFIQQLDRLKKKLCLKIILCKWKLWICWNGTCWKRVLKYP